MKITEAIESLAYEQLLHSRLKMLYCNGSEIVIRKILYKKKAGKYLTIRELSLLRHRYKGKLSYREIGNKYGVTGERIKQIIEKALAKLAIIDIKEIGLKGKDIEEEMHERIDTDCERIARILNNIELTFKTNSK